MRNHFWSFPEGYYYTHKKGLINIARDCFLASGDMMRCKWLTFLVPYGDLMKLVSQCRRLHDEWVITKVRMFLLKILSYWHWHWFSPTQKKKPKTFSWLSSCFKNILLCCQKEGLRSQMVAANHILKESTALQMESILRDKQHLAK